MVGLVTSKAGPSRIDFASTEGGSGGSSFSSGAEEEVGGAVGSEGVETTGAETADGRSPSVVPRAAVSFETKAIPLSIPPSLSQKLLLSAW